MLYIHCNHCALFICCSVVLEMPLFFFHITTARSPEIYYFFQHVLVLFGVLPVAVVYSDEFYFCKGLKWLVEVHSLCSNSRHSLCRMCTAVAYLRFPGFLQCFKSSRIVSQQIYPHFWNNFYRVLLTSTDAHLLVFQGLQPQRSSNQEQIALHIQTAFDATISIQKKNRILL